MADEDTNGRWGSPNPNYIPSRWGSDSSDEDDDKWGEPEAPAVLAQVAPLPGIAFARPQLEIELSDQVPQEYGIADPEELLDTYGAGYNILTKYGPVDDEIKLPADPVIYRKIWRNGVKYNGFSGPCYEMTEWFYQAQANQMKENGNEEDE